MEAPPKSNGERDILAVAAAWARAGGSADRLGSPQLRRLALWSASRLGPEPWLSLVSVGVGLAAGVCGGIILQLEPNIAAPDWLVCTLMTLWFGFECMIALLVRAIDMEAASTPTH
jgi:hypothetical protein